MMINGYRKLTKYTPFIHLIIHSFNGSMDWTAFLFLSVLLSVNDELILYDIQHSFAFWISYLSSIDWLSEWVSGLCDIEEYDIPSKYRIVKPRLILLLTTTIKYQTHPIWFHYYQIDKSMFCDSLINKQTNKQMIVGLIEWWIQYDFQCYSIGFYSILFYSSFIALFYPFHLYLILFYVYSDRFLFNKSKSIS